MLLRLSFRKNVWMKYFVFYSLLVFFSGKPLHSFFTIRKMSSRIFFFSFKENGRRLKLGRREHCCYLSKGYRGEAKPNYVGSGWRRTSLGHDEEFLLLFPPWWADDGISLAFFSLNSSGFHIPLSFTLSPFL